MGCCGSKQERLKQDIALDPNILMTDILIIGAGLSGCYMADQLKKQNPKAKIVMVERSARVGGRICSSDNDGGDQVQDELGGMRHFPEKMPKIYELIKRFNLTSIPHPLNDKNSIFCSFDKLTLKRDAKIPKDIYPVGKKKGKEEEGLGKYCGEHPNQIVSDALEKYKKTCDWKSCKGDAFLSSELRNMSVPEFLKKYAGATDEEIRYMFDFSGYNVWHNDIQAAMMVAHGELLGSDPNNHNFVKEGYMQIVIGLRNASGVEPHMRKNVTNIRKGKNCGKIIAELEDGKTIKCNQLVIAVNAGDMTYINGVDKLISKERWDYIQCAKPIALFKVFLEFPNPWWIKHGFTGGKSTTENRPKDKLSGRQIHYYDREDLLVYSTDGDGKQNVGDTYATNWQRMLLKQGPKAVYEKMFKEIKEMHMKMGVPEKDISPPNYDQCVYAYWPSGVGGWWKCGCDVPTATYTIPDGKTDGSGIFIVGDTFSSMQGWTEGCIESCNMAVEIMTDDGESRDKERDEVGFGGGDDVEMIDVEMIGVN